MGPTVRPTAGMSQTRRRLIGWRPRCGHRENEAGRSSREAIWPKSANLAHGGTARLLRHSSASFFT